VTASTELKNWLLLLFLSVIWGTSFILIKRSLLAFTAVEVAVLRVSISAIAFLPIFIYHFRNLEWKRWWFYLIISLTGTGLPAILYSEAQTQLSSATSGILNSMTPVFALIIGIFLFKNSTSKKQVLGTLLGFVGVALLIALDKPLEGGSENTIYYGSLVVIGTIMYGVNVNLVKEYFQNVSAIELSTFAFVLLGIPILCLIPFTEIPAKVMSHPDGVTSLLAVSALALVSTVMALIIFYTIVQETSAVFGSSVAYIIPIVAILWGLFDGEFIGWMHVVSMATILVGVFLIRSGQVVHFPKDLSAKLN